MLANVDSVLLLAAGAGLLLVAVLAGWPLAVGVAMCAHMWKALI